MSNRLERRKRVWRKYDKRCAYCGKELEYKDMQVDHLVPKYAFEYLEREIERKGKPEKLREEFEQRYGIDCLSMDDPRNLMPSCRSCNHYKSTFDLDGFREQMATIHERIKKDYITRVGLDYGIVELKPFDGKFYFEKL